MDSHAYIKRLLGDVYMIVVSRGMAVPANDPCYLLRDDLWPKVGRQI
jgi:hypothetical protein